MAKWANQNLQFERIYLLHLHRIKNFNGYLVSNIKKLGECGLWIWKLWKQPFLWFHLEHYISLNTFSNSDISCWFLHLNSKWMNELMMIIIMQKKDEKWMFCCCSFGEILVLLFRPDERSGQESMSQTTMICSIFLILCHFLLTLEIYLNHCWNCDTRHYASYTGYELWYSIVTKILLNFMDKLTACSTREWISLESWKMIYPMKSKNISFFLFPFLFLLFYWIDSTEVN